MRAGFQFGLRILSKYLMLLILGLMFYALIPRDTLWLQLLLNALFVAGFALFGWSEGGYLGERAETLRASLAARRESGGRVDPADEARAFSPRTAVTGFIIGALPLLFIAMLNLASLPAHPESLNPVNFNAPDVIEEVEAAPENAATLPDTASVAPNTATTAPDAAGAAPDTATAAPDAAGAAPDTATAAPDSASVAPDTATAAPDAAGAAPDTATAAPDSASEPALINLVTNPVNAVARIAFLPFISLYALLSNHLMALYLLMIPLSFFLPAFSMAGYLRGPKLRQRKLDAIRKGIRAKKRKERRERRPSGPKPEV